MSAKVWVAGLLALNLSLAGSHACFCNGIINSRGEGECQTSYRGKRFCYVDQGECEDEKKGSSSDRFWSYEACENYRDYGPECFGLNGERCTFPFTWDGRTFNNCTTYKSEKGAAWCATRVWKRDREAVRGSLQDCSAPCDFGASPHDDCPRNPVVQVLSRHCCNSKRPCGVGEGDCDTDEDCGNGLKCGKRNCAQFRPENFAGADCCYNPWAQLLLTKARLCQVHKNHFIKWTRLETLNATGTQTVHNHHHQVGTSRSWNLTHSLKCQFVLHIESAM